MVRVHGPLYSLSARGWLGKLLYRRRGVVRNPYPIALLPRGLKISLYYNYKGWCYQRRRTWHGIVWSAMKAYTPTNPNSPAQQARRLLFAQAVAAWQALTSAEQDEYNKRRYPPRIPGYNRFLREYLNNR